MSETAAPPSTARKRRSAFSDLITALVVLFILLLIAGIAGLALKPRGGIFMQRESPCLQQTRSIYLLLFSYAANHHGKYPDGESSTEVFQKLLDEDYATDPAVFYLPLPGKSKPLPGQKLKPENVCFDMTAGVNANDPDQLPVVFTTGYRVIYTPKGTAEPLTRPGPQFGGAPRTWVRWWHGEPPPSAPLPGIAVGYKNNDVVFLKLETPENSNASIPNFISSDFKPDGKTYRQLTPDGPLAP